MIHRDHYKDENCLHIFHEQSLLFHGSAFREIFMETIVKFIGSFKDISTNWWELLLHFNAKYNFSRRKKMLVSNYFEQHPHGFKNFRHIWRVDVLIYIITL